MPQAGPLFSKEAGCSSHVTSPGESPSSKIGGGGLARSPRGTRTSKVAEAGLPAAAREGLLHRRMAEAGGIEPPARDGRAAVFGTVRQASCHRLREVEPVAGVAPAWASYRDAILLLNETGSGQFCVTSNGAGPRTAAIARRRVSAHLIRQRRQRKRCMPFFHPQRGQIQRILRRMSFSFPECFDWPCERRRLVRAEGIAPPSRAYRARILLLK